MPRLRIALLALAALVLGGTSAAFAAGVGRGGGPDRSDGAAQGQASQRPPYRRASATLRTASGAPIGRVWMSQRRRGGAVAILVRVHGLSPGFHGFHIHTTGRCDPPGFTTAGGHFNPTGVSHPRHAGDLPSLLVNANGTGQLATTTDRFAIGNLTDADGSAVIVHSGPDNFANIPARYGVPDQETLNTGDSGSRVACGVVRRAPARGGLAQLAVARAGAPRPTEFGATAPVALRSVRLRCLMEQ
jgi:superoxide dismutase, Cu-Zn family